MESILKHSNDVKGVEVLYFEEAEVEKYKGSFDSFGSMGPLSVLYFKDYNRFVLQINDWKYPLLRRLPVILTSDRNNSSHRTYVLPGNNGFTFQLKLLKITNLQALINFETILTHSSIFSIKGEDTSMRKRELSPEDKLVRHHNKDTGAKEIITEKIHSVMHNISRKATTLREGTKYLTSTRRALDLKSIKNKNFRKNAKPSFKKNFFAQGSKQVHESLDKRNSNKNLFEAKEFSALMKTSDTPICYIRREDIEEAILRNKDLALSGQFAPLEKEEKKTGLIQNLKESLHDVKEMATIKKDELLHGSRAGPVTEKDEKISTMESIQHHSEA